MSRSPPLRRSALEDFLGDLKMAGALLPYLDGLKALIAVSVVLGLLSSVVESVTVGVIVFFIFRSLSEDIAMPQEGPASRYFDLVAGLAGDSAWGTLGVILAALLLKSLMRGSYGLLSAHITNVTHHRVRTALFGKYLSLPYKDLAKKDYGAMVNSLQVESWYVPEVIKAVSGLVISLCYLCVYLGIVFFFSWPVALVLIGMGIVMKLSMAGLKRPLRALGFVSTAIHEQMSLRMFTRMQGLKTIRAHGRETSEIQAFEGLSQDVARAFTRMSIVDCYVRPVYDLSALVIVAALIWFSSAVGNAPALTATIIVMVYRLQPYFYALEGALMTLMKSEGPLRAILRQLREPDIRQEDPGSLPVPPAWQSLRFDHVSFAYDSDNIIHDLCFEVRRGQTLVVTGASGAGKSTLINLILKLTCPCAGRIYLDDVPFESINRQSWQSGIAAAGQDFELLDGSLQENLTLGRDIPAERLDEALDVAEIKAFTESLPDGLATRIGERGLRLSGGQRQRIVLARALAFDPDILILDEATSEIGLAMEKRIYAKIRAWKPDLTILLITHRKVPPGFADVRLEL